MTAVEIMPAAQRRAADPAKSVWVAASAGTGKTKVLIDRVLNLLLDGAPPGRLLCLTFTKAAAKEMALRLAKLLSSWATTSDEALASDLEDMTGARPDPERLAHARRLFARVLDAPGGLRVDTLHAFCQSLLARFPIEAGLAPHFAVMDERSGAELLAESRGRVLTRCASDPKLAAALDIVAARTQEAGFVKSVESIVKERVRLNRLLLAHGGVDGLGEAIARRLGLDPDDTPESVTAEALAPGALPEAMLVRLAQALAAGSPTDRKLGAALADFLAPPARRVERFDAYLDVFFTQKGTPRSPSRFPGKDARRAAPGIETVVAQETQRLEATLARRKAAVCAQASAALVRLAGAVLRARGLSSRR